MPRLDDTMFTTIDNEPDPEWLRHNSIVDVEAFIADLRSFTAVLKAVTDAGYIPPPIKSITMHPSDLLVLAAKVKLVERSDGAVLIGKGDGIGIPIFTSTAVKPGDPWFDPPESNPKRRKRTP